MKDNKLTEEQINANYLRYIQATEKYGCYSESMFAAIGDKIKYGTYNTSTEYGGCYKGALLDVTLKVLCTNGVNLNDGGFGKDPVKGTYKNDVLYCNNQKLMKVLLLSNISKAVMFVPESDTYWQSRGRLYKFVNDDVALMLGQHSLYLCQQYGIKLEEDEYEAIASIDDKENKHRYRNILCLEVATAREFTNAYLWKTKEK